MVYTGALAENNTAQMQQSFIRLLEADPNMGKTMPKNYLSQFVAQFDDDVALKKHFEPVLLHLTQKLQARAGHDVNFPEQAVGANFQMLTLDSAHRPLNLLMSLAREQRLAQLFVTLPAFLPPPALLRSGRHIETLSIMGPVTALTSVNAESLAKMTALVRDNRQYYTPYVLDIFVCL